MRALLASPLGLLVGLALGALGGGGSILAVPLLVYAAGQDPRSATATSLLLVGAAAVVGIAPHRRAGRVRAGIGVVFGLTGIAGSLAGSALNRRLDPDVLLLAFAGLVVVAAWRMLTGCPTCTRVGERAALTGGRGSPGRLHLDPRVALGAVLAGTVVGFLTGLFGVGGGFVIVPALALALELPMPQAIGTSLVAIAINCAVALASRLATTSIEWGVTIPFAIAAIMGVLAGGRIADRLDAQRSLRWFAALLVAVALYTGTRAAAAIWG